MNDKVLFVAILGLAITGVSFAIADPFDLPLVYAQVIETTGQNYDLIENYNIGEAKWTSHPERIMINGEWENYFLQANDQQIIFRSNSVGGFIYDIPSCSYSIYENGFDGNQIIPSVSSVASYSVNGNWQNMAVNQEECLVNFSQGSNGIFITSTKTLFGETNQPIFQSYNGTGSTVNVNGTSYNVISNGNQTGYYVDNFVPVETEKFVQELKVDIFGGIKETFKVWNESDEPLGISQTVHTGESITIGENTLNIAELNGQSFSKQFLEDNKAQVFEIAESLNYDFDLGFDSLSNVNIFFDGNYKVNLDYASGNFVNYLEIDPTLTVTSTSGKKTSGTGTGNTCPTGTTLSTTMNFHRSRASGGSAGDGCSFLALEFDVSSLPSGSVISSTTFSASLSHIWGESGGDPLDVIDIPTVDFTTVTASGLFSAITSSSATVLLDNDTPFDGTSWSNPVTSSTFTTNPTINNNDKIVLGFRFSPDGVNENRDTQWVGLVFTSPQLELTYAIPTYPQPPTNLQTVTGIPIELSWTAPVDDGGSSLTGYKVYRTLNQYVMTELPNNGGTTGVDFTDNELLLHGGITTTVNPFSSPTTKGTFGSNGAGNGQFSTPYGAVFLTHGTYADHYAILDYSNNDLQFFDPDGNYVTSLGSFGTSVGQFDRPESIDVDSNGNIYTGEYKFNYRIQKWNPDGTNPTSIINLGSSSEPYGMVIDSNDNIFVADGGAGLTKKFTSGSWTYSSVSDSGTRGICVDSNDDVYTLHGTSSTAVKKFDNDLNLLSSSLFTLYGAYDCVIDSNDNMYISGQDSNTYGYVQKRSGTNYATVEWTQVSASASNNLNRCLALSNDETELWACNSIDRTIVMYTIGDQVIIADDSSPNTLTVTAPSGSTTTGLIDNGISAPNLSVTSSLLPDGTDSFTVGSWVKQTATPTNTKLFGFTNSNGDDVAFNVGTTTADFGKETSSTVTTDITWDINESVDITLSNNDKDAVSPHTNSVVWGNIVTSSQSFTVGNAEFRVKPTGNFYEGVLGFAKLSDIQSTGGLDAYKTPNSVDFYSVGTTAYIGDSPPQSGTWWSTNYTVSSSDELEIRVDTSGNAKLYKNGSVLHSYSTVLSGTYYVFASAPYSATMKATYTGSGIAFTPIISATGLTDNTSNFQHYALTRDGSSWTLYQNGASVSTATDSTDLGTVSGSHKINIDGSIDEYFIDSTALSSNEIEAVYGMGSEPSLLTTTGTTTSYDDSGVTGGNTYYYYVKSTNAIGDSDFSTQATGLAGTPPDAPTGLSASIQNTNTAPRDIFLQWSAPTNVGSGTLTGFEIWRDGSLVTTVGLISSYVDIVPTVGTYTYTVKAVSTHGTSVDSNSAQITTPNLPDAPQGLTLSIDNPNPSPLTVTVTVSPPLNDGGSAVTGYNIYTSTDDITYTLQASNTSNPSNITVASAGLWYFKAEAVNGVGAGALSSNAIIGTPNVPDAPTSVTTNIPDVNNAPSSVVVAWSNGLTNGGSAITGYNVYRDGSLLTSLGTGIFTYTDTATKTASTSYTYEVRITNNVGESLGTQSSITTPSPPNAPVLSVETGTTKATWTVPTSDATITNYKLYRDGSLVATVSGSTTTYIDRTLITFGNSYDYQVSAVSSIGEGTLSNTVTTTPDTEVDDATAFGTTGTSSIIDWTEPPYFQGEVTSYSVYYSTPYSSNPTTLIGTTGNTYLNLYNQLQYDTNYAFMVLVNSPLGNTSVGNVVNATTTENLGIVTYDPTTGANWFDIDAVNQEDLSTTKYTRVDNGDTVLLEIEYPTNYEDMTCDVGFKFGQQTLQYVEGEDMTATALDAEHQAVVMQFNNQGNEVITVECADQNVPNSASSYTVTTTFGNFPLLTQITDFRTGEYGTSGMFGALDLITLFVVIISMVGFNRINPIAGVIMGVSAISGLAYFGVINLPPAIVGIFALLAFLAWGVTRK
jgi:hypothetical protein